METGNEFLNLGLQGRRSWQSYILGIMSVSFLWIAAGVLLSLPLLLLYESMAQGTESASPAALLILYLVVNISLVPLLPALFVVVRLIHLRPFLTLITSRPYFDWKRTVQGFGTWLILIAAASAAEAVLYPGRYQFTPNLEAFLPFLPFALALTPIQAAAEEVLFRGYLMQGAGLLSRRFFFPAIVSSALFTLVPGLNAEAAGGFLPLAYYFAYGIFASFITLRENRMELAIGVHAANNLFTVLFANYADSSIPSPAIFTLSQLDMGYGLLSLAVAGAIFYFILLSGKSAGKK